MLSCLTTQHDYRLVLLAAVVCTIAAFTSFQIYARATDARSTRDTLYRRLVWLFLTGISTGTGIWATHFVAMLAYDAGLPTNYDPVLTIVSLVIAIAVTTVGFALSARGGERDVLAGGAVIGAGIGAMHFTGMAAVSVPGTLQWHVPLVVPAIALGMILTCAAMLAFRRLERSRALWIAPGVLTLAICSLHFTAMGAVLVVPDPTIECAPR